MKRSEEISKLKKELKSLKSKNNRKRNKIKKLNDARVQPELKKVFMSNNFSIELVKKTLLTDEVKISMSFSDGVMRYNKISVYPEEDFVIRYRGFSLSETIFLEDAIKENFMEAIHEARLHNVALRKIGRLELQEEISLERRIKDLTNRNFDIGDIVKLKKGRSGRMKILRYSVAGCYYVEHEPTSVYGVAPEINVSESNIERCNGEKYGERILVSGIDIFREAGRRFRINVRDDNTMFFFSDDGDMQIAKNLIKEIEKMCAVFDISCETNELTTTISIGRVVNTIEIIDRGPELPVKMKFS